MAVWSSSGPPAASCWDNRWCLWNRLNLLLPRCNFDGCDKPEFFPKLINGWFWSANQVLWPHLSPTYTTSKSPSELISGQNAADQWEPIPWLVSYWRVSKRPSTHVSNPIRMWKKTNPTHFSDPNVEKSKVAYFTYPNTICYYVSVTSQTLANRQTTLLSPTNSFIQPDTTSYYLLQHICQPQLKQR